MAWDDWRPRDPALLPGFDLWRAGRLQEAEAFFRERLDDGGTEAARGLGSVLWSMRRFEEARAAYSTAIEAEPWNAMNWGNLGLALRDLNRLEAASSAFSIATGLDPLYEPGWNEWGNVLYDMDRPSEALPLYDRALAISDARAVVHHNRGMCLLALSRRQEAETAFRSALARDPAYSYARAQLELMARTTVLD